MGRCRFCNCSEPICFRFDQMVGMLTATVLIFTSFYSLFLQFRAVCRNRQTRRGPAFVWFFALPTAYYLFTFAPFVTGFVDAAQGHYHPPLPVPFCRPLLLWLSPESFATLVRLLSPWLRFDLTWLLLL